MRRHLLDISDLDRPEVARILRESHRFSEVMDRDIKKVPSLRGRSIINLFFEASTRTSTSFELAGKRLSADVVNVKGSGSSVEITWPSSGTKSVTVTNSGCGSTMALKTVTILS